LTPNRRRWSGVVNGDPSKGETNTATVLPVKDKVIVGISGGEFGVRGHVTAYNMGRRDGWRAYSMGPDSDTLIDPEKTTHLGQPVGKDSGTNDLGRRPVEDRWRCHLGLVSPTIRKPT
jgi:glucose dehydrogenase